jgi:hypothetical protein
MKAESDGNQAVLGFSLFSRSNPITEKIREIPRKSEGIS